MSTGAAMPHDPLASQAGRTGSPGQSGYSRGGTDDVVAQRTGAARELLHRGEYRRAIDLLEPVASHDQSGDSHALLGDAHFMLEQYDLAERHFRAAIEMAPTFSDWEARLALAEANVAGAVHEFVPLREEFVDRFDRSQLTSGPAGHAYDITGPVAMEAERFFHRVSEAIGNAGGAVGGAILHRLSELTGKMGVKDAVWTNWYQDHAALPGAIDEALKIFKLSFMRGTLFENNLLRTYPESAKTAFASNGESGPPVWALYARTDDGSWNWLPRDEHDRPVTTPDARHDPMVGAAMTRFYRNVGDDIGVESTRGRTHPGVDPSNVLETSHVLLTRGEMKEVPFLNLAAAAWIQFMIHDWVSHGDNVIEGMDAVPVPAGHPARERYHLDEMPVQRTQPDPTRIDAERHRPPTYINEVTHWWDGSQLYGSHAETVRRVRTGPDGAIVPDGKLYLTPDDRLPVDPRTGVELTGFNRNWWVGLSLLHTLFAREHNAICDTLRAAHPSMTGDELFAKARLITAAVMAKIHTVEWTPAILPNKALFKGMRANWYGLLTDLFDSSEHPRTVAEINVKNRELGGIIGNPQGTFAKYALSEEFTAVYRMHSLLPDDIRILPTGIAGNAPDVVPLMRTRQSAARQLLDRYPIESLWGSFGVQLPGQLVLNNFPRGLQTLSVPGLPFQDLGAIDLYRDRERGVPPYNQLRRELGLNPIRTFDELTDNAQDVANLRRVYGQTDGRDNVESIDLLIGTLAESHRPAGFGFGETLFQVFVLNASWRLLGDRFFTDDYRAEVYTSEGLEWIDRADMKSILLRHYPSLERTGLGNVKNAFEPWDEGTLDPARHPLRAWDKATRDDPWRGDRH